MISPDTDDRIENRANLHVRLPRQLLERLQAEARSQGESASVVLRRLLRQALAAERRTESQR